MNATEIPVTGTPAYWTAQREGVALVRDWLQTLADPEQELDLLRRIAAHGFATRIMHAHGRPIERWIAILETMAELFEAEDADASERAGPDAPPHGDDWCRRGCQVMHGMECGICGYDGPGVRADQTDTVAEYCCHCRARTYQSPDGICERCGMDAETFDAPAPYPALCFQNCSGDVTRDSQCGLCRDLERQARSIVAAARQEGQAAPGLATAALLARAALACSRHPLTVNPCTHHP